MKQQLDQNFQTRKPLNKIDNDKKNPKGKRAKIKKNSNKGITNITM